MSGERLTVVEKALLHMTTPVASASDVAGAVQERSDVLEDAGDPRREVLDDLRLLERSGDVHSRKVGARARAWWHDQRVVPAPPEDPADHPDQADLEDASEPRPRPEPAPIDEEIDADPLAGFDIPAGVDRAGAAAAIVAVVQLLEREGSATKAEIVREVMPDHSLTYDADDAIAKLDAGDRYRGAWWRRVVKPGLKASDHVDAPPRGGSEWTHSSSRSS